jgi:hypothetical protein
MEQVRAAMLQVIIMELQGTAMVLQVTVTVSQVPCKAVEETGVLVVLLHDAALDDVGGSSCRTKCKAGNQRRKHMQT